jgi:uncharacterized protein YegP (UPF0339 family)
MKFRIYRTEDGIRWEVLARNGKVLAASPEAYATPSNCRRAAKSFERRLRAARFIVITDETQKQ